MDRNLYEVLGLTRDASPEQIRKAYRKKALETHPDRSPPDASEEDKSVAAERFRAVNNAYEVLVEPKNRRLYDIHGVWPPPEQHKDEPHHRSSRHRYEPTSHSYHAYTAPFPDHMYTNHFTADHHHPHFSFTNPFALFDSIFGDFQRGNNVNPMNLPFPHHHHGEPHSHRHGYAGHLSDEHHYEDPAYSGPHHRRHTRSQGSSFPPTQTSAFYHHHSSSHGFGTNGRWTQESKVTTTVNGVSQTVWKRTDSDGNVHVTKIYPDGREKYAVNGVEQPSQRQDRYLSRGGSGERGNGYHQPSMVDLTLGLPQPSSYAPRDHRHRHGPRSAPIRPDYNRSHERVIPDPNMYGDSYPDDQKRSWWRR